MLKEAKKIRKELLKAGGFEPNGRYFCGYRLTFDGIRVGLEFTSERVSPMDVLFTSPDKAIEARDSVGVERLLQFWFAY